MVEHFGKYRSLMQSLALIFLIHVAADQYEKESNKETALYNDEQGRVVNDREGAIVPVWAAEMAVKWCEYLESHARRIYAMAESPEHEAAVRLAKKIKAGALASPFNSRIIERKCWHGLKDKLEIDVAYNILIDEDW